MPPLATPRIPAINNINPNDTFTGASLAAYFPQDRSTLSAAGSSAKCGSILLSGATSARRLQPQGVIPAVSGDVGHCALKLRVLGLRSARVEARSLSNK